MSSPAISHTTETSPLDVESVLDRVGGDLDLLKEIVSIFEQEGPALLEEIRNAITLSDLQRLESAAHSLKGCVSTFGADNAAAAALRLEQMGRQGRMEGAEDAVADLERELGTLRPVLLELAA